MRWTEAELDILRGVVGFVDAGEISGGPLEGATDEEQERNIKIFDRIKEKLRMR